MVEPKNRESICPLCGGDNRCAMAAVGQAPENCWCLSVSISAETLAALPAESVGKHCICQNCAATEGEPSRAR